MRKIIIILALILITAIYFGCIFNPSTDKEAWMTFSAYFETDSGYESRIVLADYNDLENYRFITEPDLEAYNSYISKTKKKIIIRKRGGIIHNDNFVLYDIERDTLISLYNTRNSYEEEPLSGTKVYWDYNDKGFYYCFDSSWGSSYYYYDLATNQISNVNYIIVGLFSENELLIFKSDGYYNQTGVKDCLYTLDIETDELSQIINPNLEYINIDGRVSKWSHFLNWNEEKEMFLYAYSDTTESGRRISITNFTGTYKKEFTNSYFDEYPVWGPDNIVFFNRVRSEDYSYIYEGAFVLNTHTKSINRLSDLVNIENANILMNVSY